ncbi:MAG: tRNA (adenosine(37)-N6)-threonylcarbamoyltransferase complex ATPase subunit type 1 TsaE [Myxococcota bacterium]
MDAQAALTFRFDSPAPETTAELAELLGRSIGARGLAIGLVGPLGAGKTLFVKGLAAGLGVDPRIVSSPTFVIAQQYFVPEGPEALHHLDLYRLASEAELESIGFLDLLGPGQVLAVEWLDRFPDVLGPDRLEIELAPPAPPSPSHSALPPGAARSGAGIAPGEAGDEDALRVDTGRRTIRASAFGDEAARVLRDWADRWSRLAREEPAAESGGGRSQGDGAKLLVALFLAALLGTRSLPGPPEPAAACAALEGAGAAAAASADAPSDGLGDVAVVCRAEFGGDARERRLAGMARLLDGGRIDPNAAPQALLENLPGIGPGRARAILEARGRRPFDSVREIERVPGIGPRTREKLDPFLTVDSPPPG